MGDFQLNYRLREWGVFFQDDWKATRNLTLNFGVRYMYYTPPYDSRNAISSWTQPQECPSYTVCGPELSESAGGQPLPGVLRARGRGSAALAGSDRQEEHRAAVRLSPGSRSAARKTVIRGGYGIFYDTVAGVAERRHAAELSAGNRRPGECRFRPEWPAGSECADRLSDQQAGLGQRRSGSVAQFPPGPNNFNPNFRNAYIQSWNLSIQRQLPGQMVVEVAYAGTKGTRLHRQIVLNLAEPLGPFAVVPDLTNNPNIRSDIGDSRNQMRRLVPVTLEQGRHHTPGQRLRRTVHGVFELPRRHAAG